MARTLRISRGSRDVFLTSAARQAGLVIPHGAAVSQLGASMIARGDGGLDHSALPAPAEELSGRGN